MAVENEYCIMKDGVVENVIVSAEGYATAYATASESTAVQRPHMGVGIGHKFHDNKWWAMVNDVDEGGNPLETMHEQEIADPS